jgi:hypothetical protein
MEVNNEIKKPKLIEMIKTQKLANILASQKYQDIIKSKEKWTDDLFPPENSSIFNGKTEFSGYSLFASQHLENESKVNNRFF